MAESPVRVVHEGNVAVMVLSNPPLNLFTAEAWTGLVDSVDEIAASDARAMVWRAEGDIFTGGVDVEVFRHAQEEGIAAEAFGSLIETARKIETLEIPTLSLVHGLCLTAGLEIALATDILWAAESAKFGLVEAVVGLTPGAGGTQRMAERAGPARAAEFVMTGGLYRRGRRSSSGTSSTASCPTTTCSRRACASPSAWPTARPSPTRPRSGSSAPTARAASTRPTRSRRTSSPTSSTPRT